MTHPATDSDTSSERGAKARNDLAMSKEFHSYTNKVRLDDEGHVVKTFEDLGVTEMPARLRLEREVFALTCSKLLAPKLISLNGSKVTMSYVDGEHGLDEKTSEMSEGLQHSVFREAGFALSHVHAMKYGRRLPNQYHDRQTRVFLSRIYQMTPHLVENGIDPAALNDYATNGYQEDVVETAGQVFTHGDFWLDNLIGSIKKDGFDINAVVDWEMGGFGSPFDDFALVELSMERPHPISKSSFWGGYGDTPDTAMKRYFAIKRILIWMNGEEDRDFSSEFYQEKFDLIKATI